MAWDVLSRDVLSYIRCIVPKVLSVKLGGVRMSEFTFKIVIYLSRA